jgi:hypothetical protein
MLMAQVQASTANAAAARTQANAALAAHAAQPANSKRFKPAPSPKFENKDKDLKIRKWLPVIEEHYEGCPPEDYFHLASSHLSGKPRSFVRASTMLSRLLVLSWPIHVLSVETLCSWAMV